MGRITNLPKPSYQQGYARSRGEAAYPWAWDGLVACYEPSLGPTGGTLFDHAGRRLNGTINGALWVPTEKGWALEFDGSNDVDCGAAPALTGAMTVNAWFRGSSIDANAFCVFGNIGASGSRGFGIGPNNGSLVYCQIASSSTATFGINSGSGQHSSSVWEMWTMVFVPSTRLSLYKGGALINETTSSVPAQQFTTGAVTLKIGQRGDTLAWFDGLIGDASIHSRALSADEIWLLSLGASPLTLKPRRAFSGFTAGGGGLTGNASWDWSESGELSGSGTLSGSLDWQWDESGSLSGTGALSGSSAWVWSESGALAGAGSLSGSSDWSWTASGTVGSGGALAGDASWTWDESGTLSGSGALSGESAWSWTASLVNFEGAIFGTAAWTWTITGDLHGCRRYSGCVDTDFNYAVSGDGNCSSGYSGCNTDDYGYSS